MMTDGPVIAYPTDEPGLSHRPAEAERRRLLEVLIHAPPAVGLSRSDALTVALGAVRTARPSTRLDYDALVLRIVERCTYSDARWSVLRTIRRGLVLLRADLGRTYSLAAGIVALERSQRPDRYSPTDCDGIYEEVVGEEDVWRLDDDRGDGDGTELPAGHVAAWRRRVAAVERELAPSAAAARTERERLVVDVARERAEERRR